MLFRVLQCFLFFADLYIVAEQLVQLWRAIGTVHGGNTAVFQMIPGSEKPNRVFRVFLCFTVFLIFADLYTIAEQRFNSGARLTPFTVEILLFFK